MNYCKNCGTFHPWLLIILKRKLLHRWKRLIANWQLNPCWTVQLFSANVSKNHRKLQMFLFWIIIWIFQFEYLDSPDTSLNSSAISLPALYSQLQQSSSTSSPQKPVAARPIDPYQSNYIRMERKFKTTMRKVQWLGKNIPTLVKETKSFLISLNNLQNMTNFFFLSL